MAVCRQYKCVCVCLYVSLHILDDTNLKAITAITSYCLHYYDQSVVVFREAVGVGLSKARNVYSLCAKCRVY
jgi:hypothetical protein